MRRLAAILVFLFVAGPSAARAQQAAPKAAATPSKGERERRAQAAFIAGRYQEAAELLDGLYIEFNNPVYLRNLGRCYQRLKQPERAIAAFEEYLLRDRSLKPSERQEIQGFIRDMEELKRQQDAAAATPPPPPPPPVVVAPPPTTAPTVAVTPQTPPVVSTTPDEAPRAGSGKLIGGILMGAAALMAAGGGAMLASAWSEQRKGEKYPCPGFAACAGFADRVEQRALISKILFGAAAATGIAGGTVFVLSMSPGSSTAGTGMTVAIEGKF